MVKKVYLCTMNLERFLAKNRVAVVATTLVLFGAAFAVESIGNHLLFRTYGLDLGLYAKTLYDHAHLHSNDGTFFLWSPANQLGGHFDLLLMLLSPLAWLVRADWLLLIVQILAVLAGAWGVYRLARLYSRGELLPVAAMLTLLLQFGVWHALSYDYHSNVVAACLLPWLLYFIKRERLGAATAMLILMAMAKETTVLWLCAVLVALLWEYRRNRRVCRWLLIATAGCTAWFLAVTLWIMPSLGGGGGTGFWRYSWMGASVGEVVRWLLTHPIEAVRSMFIDFTPDADSVTLKREFILCALASGLLLTLLKPDYLVMLLPPLAMKMLAADPLSFWGVNYHYNIEISVVTTIAAMIVLSRLDRRRPYRLHAALGAMLMVALTASTLFYTINHPLTPIRQANVNILKPNHYQQPDFDIKEARKALRMIPRDASVCAVTPFTPHLAARDSVYIFPMGLAYNAEYYLLLRQHWCYYEGEQEQAEAMISDTTNYQTISSSGNIILLQRCK